MGEDAALLALADGTLFRGYRIGAQGVSVGEIVFNTSMTGYQEILTDPSYAEQIVTLTYPHIGNTGVNSEDEEARDIWAKGLVVRDVSLVTSSWRAQESLQDYLQRRHVVGIAGIDTRALTRVLRNKGAQNACVMTGKVNEAEAIELARAFPGLKGMDLAQKVTTGQAYAWNQQGRYKVVALDFGVKHNILRLLADHDCDVTVLPAKTDAKTVLEYQPDGVFLSNGPGDPEPCDYAIKTIKNLLDVDIPLFGICLGHQLLALASGAQTVKMKFGHHGANHPVKDLATGEVMITSQNHGFAVAQDNLPACLKVTHISLFDNSIQGIARVDKPAFGFQGHPEASPGPHDAGGLFGQFIQQMQARQKQL